VGICREWQCQLTLVVYPWPDNVVAHDKDSIQVSYWRAWAAEHGVRFIDGFAPFFREPADTAMRKYYIAGDVHFTELGNRLIYDEVRRAINTDWLGDAGMNAILMLLLLLFGAAYLAYTAWTGEVRTRNGVFWKREVDATTFWFVWTAGALAYAALLYAGFPVMLGA
jgi:hypothetical protein